MYVCIVCIVYVLTVESRTVFDNIGAGVIFGKGWALFVGHLGQIDVGIWFPY